MDQLKMLRREKGLSQAKLAALADIDPSTVNQIERGAREASAATLRKLAQALDVTLAELLEDGSPKDLSPRLPLDERGDERRAKAEVLGYFTRYASERAGHYEQELERGRAKQYATASGAAALAGLAVAEFDGFIEWSLSGPVWELGGARLQKSGAEYLADLEAAESMMLDRWGAALRVLFEHAENLAKTQQEKDELAAKRQEAAELRARVERLSA